MTEEEALSLIANLSVRIHGLLILIGEYVIPPEDNAQWQYIQNERVWHTELQDLIAVDNLLGEVFGGNNERL